MRDLPIRAMARSHATEKRKMVRPEILRDLVSDRIDTLAVAADSRPAHGRLFRDLVPGGYEYFAGHYRGEFYRCLRYYGVKIPNDPRVGVPPQAVGWLMRELGAEVEAGLRAIDANVLLTTEQRLRYLSALACHTFEGLLRIHPYANGNGHSARVVVWSIFSALRSLAT